MVKEWNNGTNGMKAASIIFAVVSAIAGCVFGIGAFYSRMGMVEEKTRATESVVVINSTRITRVEENLIYIRQGLDRIERKMDRRP